MTVIVFVVHDKVILSDIVQNVIELTKSSYWNGFFSWRD
jgi:hypothetical protein